MPSTTHSFKERLRYRFDNSISRSPLRLLIWLAGAAISIVLLFSAGLYVVHISPADEPGFFNTFWNILFQALTPNPVDPKDQPILYLLVMLVITFISLFLVSILIGALSNTIQVKMDDLRKGRSLVLEQEHTVILGWSPQIFTIISELVIANENRKQGAIIAILADRDKVEMEDAIRARLPKTENTKVICRSGNPLDLNDLEIVSPHSARSIIILPQGKDPDSHVVKCVLAIVNNPRRRAEPYHIVTQIHDSKDVDVVRMIGARDHVLPILANDLIARVVAQTSRQSGLSVVYTELMNFSGDEIYFAGAEDLIGRTYGDALLAYEDSSVMGLEKANGRIEVNPPMNTLIESGDRIFAISRDDDTIRLSNLAAIPVNEKAIRTHRALRKRAPEKYLILGWNRFGAVIVRELDHYVSKGSLLTVVTDLHVTERQIRAEAGRLVNQRLTVKEGDTTDRALLNELRPAQYNHVIALAYGHLDPQEADAKTLVTLLHLRDMVSRDDILFSIVSEMLDLRNRELAKAAKVDDFIVSEHLVSLITTQLSEDRELEAIFNNIFDAEGAEIYIKPIGGYVATDEPVNFYTVVEAARRRGETAIGYRLMREADSVEKSYGVHTNPRKSETVTFHPEDKVIVLAEE